MVTRIAVDAMGGDRGSAEIVAGALEARGAGLEPVLFGDPGLEAHGLELRETSGVIGMHEKPADAVRAKPDSSLVAAVRAVAEGTADAVVSAGSTGAMLAAGLLELRRIPGVLRSCSTPGRTRTRARSTSSSSRRWAPSSRRRSSASRRPRSGCSRSGRSARRETS
jgi:fatty acid/phospholipid biosynthesis enzyme